MVFSMTFSNKTLLIIFVSCFAFDMMCSTKLLLGAKADLIDDVCSKTTTDPQFCKTALRSDPRSSKADLPTLAQIAIDLAQSHAKSTVTLVQAFKQKATDPKLKEIYDSCLENYKDTSDTLGDCNRALKAKDYPLLSQLGAAALDGPDTCDENFTNPASEPQKLKQSSIQVQELSAAISVIANRLSGRVY